MGRRLSFAAGRRPIVRVWCLCILELVRFWRSRFAPMLVGDTMKIIHAGVTAFFLFVAPVTAQTLRDVEAGLAIAKMHCARCHSVDPDGPSPLSFAPPFRDLHKLYPVESLEEALAEGIVTGHADMPQFRFEPDEVESLIVFLKTLE